MAALALVMILLLQPPFRWSSLAVAAVFLVGVSALSHIPWVFLIRRLVLLEAFVLGVAVLALFRPGGVWLFLYLVAKATLCLWVMVLLSNTTPFSELLGVMKSARVPSMLVTTLSLMYRYLFVLVDESQRMKRARMSRTFTPHRSWAWHTMASVVSQLFIRSSERAERIYAAMCARGWR